MTRLLKYIVPVMFSIGLLASCEADKITTSPDAKLSFSVDTLRFDTIFTAQGSTTKKFKIYNWSKNKVVISSIALRGEVYKINVDGKKGSYFQDVTINAKDSLVAYVQLYINPNDKTLPFIVRDSIVFMTNGNEQKVQLEAYGRNAKRFTNHTFTADTTITEAIAVLVKDTLWVPKSVKLTITDGATLYFCKNAVMMVDGTLVLQGEQNRFVTLRGDRSDYMNTAPPLCYDDASAQWGGIRFTSNSTGNAFKFANIRNSSIGIVVDSLNNGSDALKVMSCKITNSAGNLIASTANKIVLWNSLLCNAGGNILRINGGELDVKHCTIANYYSYTWGSRKSSNIQLGNMSEYGTMIPLNAGIYNTIIYGGYNNEIVYNKKEGEEDKCIYTIENCLIKIVKSNVDEHYIDCPINQSPKFVFEDWSDEMKKQNPHKYDFHLQSSSPAIGTAKRSISEEPDMRYDLDGNDRTLDGSSDIGCYEYY